MRRFVVCRRHWSAAAILIAAVSAAGSAWGDSFPYKARITVPGAPIRSGDGDVFYITDTLAEGEEVEIHRHKPNGWCAIRPPEESFSWVFGSHLRSVGDSLAEIDKDDVPSRIGSRLSVQRTAVQVRLKKGEVVQILGEVSEGGKRWCKIAPPAGEFRWIHSSCIRRVDAAADPPAADANRAPTATNPPIVTQQGPARDVADAVMTTAATDGVSAQQSPSAGDDWRAAPVAPPLANEGPTTPTPAPISPETETPTTSTTAEAPTPAAPPASAVAPSSASAPQAQPVGAVSDTLNRQLTDVELRLSRMVSGPPTQWQTDPLRREAEQLLGQAQTVAERDAVKVTLSKVERFAAIQRRYQQVAGGASAGLETRTTQQPGLAAIASTADASGETTTPDGGRYDAVGVLRPVVSKRPGAPQFALVDNRGQVISFVTATPDVNLQPYLGRRVGVIGNRGFIPEFHRAHVTAGRVMPLEERLVR